MRTAPALVRRGGGGRNDETRTLSAARRAVCQSSARSIGGFSADRASQEATRTAASPVMPNRPNWPALLAPRRSAETGASHHTPRLYRPESITTRTSRLTHRNVRLLRTHMRDVECGGPSSLAWRVRVRRAVTMPVYILPCRRDGAATGTTNVAATARNSSSTVRRRRA